MFLFACIMLYKSTQIPPADPDNDLNTLSLTLTVGVLQLWYQDQAADSYSFIPARGSRLLHLLWEHPEIIVPAPLRRGWPGTFNRGCWRGSLPSGRPLTPSCQLVQCNPRPLTLSGLCGPTWKLHADTFTKWWCCWCWFLLELQN